MSLFRAEIQAVHEALARLRPNDTKSIYAIPWYMVIGEPGSGRTTMIRAMNLTWPQDDPSLKLGIGAQLCDWWMAQEAIFCEPQKAVLGPRRDPNALRGVCEDLRRKRPREPIDGVVVLIRISDFVDLEERGVEAYATKLRTYLVEMGKYLGADIPTYIVVSGFETLWGFGDVFQWTAERAKEDAWGFLLPPDTTSQRAVPRIQEAMVGLAARFEAHCLAKLSSHSPADQRTRAYQHLVEVRTMLDKLRSLLTLFGMANAYERAPWVRALTIGCTVPGTGDRLRAGVERFKNMGLTQGYPDPNRRPGGLPVHSFLRDIVIPEKDLVPLRMRWRDDVMIVVSFIIGLVLLVGAGVWQLVLYLK
jgi:type VI protein secretion system component VasK